MSKKTHAVLLLADISGYTKFMKRQTVSITHAKQIIVRLLKSLIKASKPPLKVAELEGDAVFFYAMCSERDIQKTADMVKRQIIQLFNAFNKELELIKYMGVCNCDACLKAGALRLKQVIHTGNVEVERIYNTQKLFGLDVIVVHRMLKNSVPSNEYIMMSKSMFTCCESFYGLEPEKRTEDFEGIGKIDTLVFYSDAIRKTPGYDPYKKKPSLIQKLIWLFGMGPRTYLDIFGIIRIHGSFNNLPT